MTILLSGGGSGGHVTPLLAVAHELKKISPRCRIIYIGERGSGFDHLVKDNDDFDQVYSVFAGKFRRYAGQTLAQKLLDVKTNLFNLRDFFLFLIGILESLVLVKRLKPDVIFLKGGFVGVPIGLAAALLGVPYVTHDSDALPGLANRIVSPKAAYHATALPASFYGYPKEKTRSVGVLVGEDFHAITPRLQAKYKAELGIGADKQLLLVTGGSLGAQRLNDSFKVIAVKLLEKFDNLIIVHQTGKGKADLYGDYTSPRLVVLAFLKDMHRHTGAADLVVSRAGANTLAELGVQGKAVIVIPNPELTGGHQTKNAEKLAEEKAVVVVSEKRKASNSKELDKAIRDLLKNPKKRRQLGDKLKSMSPTGAAHSLAMLLLEVSGKQKPRAHNVSKKKKTRAKSKKRS